MKKIALFADGTGNSAASPNKTNVWRAYQALDRRPQSNQVAFYDNGVGTSSFTPTAILGLAFGWGLARNVRQIYGFLCRTYNCGDEIYAFGFSRGAFTIRVVVALIAHQGIIKYTEARDERDLDRLIRAAYRKYRHDCFPPSLLSWALRPVRDAIFAAWQSIRGTKPYNSRKNNRRPRIKFVGVWDTVDAYGLPVDELTRAWDMVVWPLTAKDRDLAPTVERARQALSLDEQRESFEPMLWNENGSCLARHIDRARLAQVWFAGVHSNVGGGYPDDSAALVPLLWVLQESEKNNGLAYLTEEFRRFENARVSYGPVHDSRHGYGTFYRFAPRNIEELNHERKLGLANRVRVVVNKWRYGTLPSARVHANAVNISKPIIHHSVFDRIRGGSDAYAPGNVPADYAVLKSGGEIVDGVGSGAEWPEEAKRRSDEQFRIRNKVLMRRCLYYVFLGVTVAFGAYPYIAEENGAVDRVVGMLESWLGTLSVVLRAIPEFVGRVLGLGVLDGWAQQYSSHPFAFLVFVAVISGLLLWARWVNATMNVEMRNSWRHVSTNARRATRCCAKPSGGWFGTGLAELRRRYGRRLGRYIRVGLEVVAVIVLVLALVVACSRLYFTLADGLGCVCEERAELREVGEEFIFVPTDMCFDTGVELIAGKQYEITWRISDDWSDKAIDADARGWNGAPIYMYGGTPLRRHWFVGWYEPVARVGSRLFDRYPLTLHETEMADGDGDQERLVARFTARRDGRLYLYMNDAVLFTWGGFYRNNKGTAKVVVERWEE